MTPTDPFTALAAADPARGVTTAPADAQRLVRTALAHPPRRRRRWLVPAAALATALAVGAPGEHGAALAALALLSAADQELLRLVVWDGFVVGGAGAVLGIRPAAARKRYERARARLRAAFARVAGEG